MGCPTKYQNEDERRKMNICLLICAIAVASQSSSSVSKMPSHAELRSCLRVINEGFLEGERGVDNWRGFVPLFSAVAKEYPNAAKEEIMAIESDLVSRFTLYSFACEHDDDMVKADFSSRAECVELMAEFLLLRSDTNALFRVADWLGSAVPLSTDKCVMAAEMDEAAKKDSLMLFGGRPAPRYPGGAGNALHVGPFSRTCKAKFRFRSIYNTNLEAFRDASAKHMRHAVLDGYPNLDDIDRKRLWLEFCLRAKINPSIVTITEEACP